MKTALKFAALFLMLFPVKALGVRTDAQDLPRFEVRTAPIAFFVKWTTLDLSYRVSENLVLGPSLVRYAAEGPGGMLGPTYFGWAFGGHATYYPTSVLANDGWYFGSHAYSENYKAYPHGGLYDRRDKNGFRVSGVVGRFQRVFIERRILWHAGLGLQSESHQVDYINMKSGADVVERSDRETYAVLHFEFKVGWEF